MDIFPEKYYHLYNRSNNRERVFYTPGNYLFFLNKYRYYFDSYADTLAYCLMPTHFHFLIFVKPIDVKEGDISPEDDPIEMKMNEAKRQFGTFLSSYTKSLNKMRSRHGSLFQRHTKAIEIDDESYLLSLTAYIHQNPVRAGLVRRQEDWKFSSYLDYIGSRNGTLPKKDLIYNYIKSPEEFKRYSEELLENVEKRYWV